MAIHRGPGTRLLSVQAALLRQAVLEGLAADRGTAKAAPELAAAIVSLADAGDDATRTDGFVALVAAGLGHRLTFGGWFYRALAGIATMFVLNLGVSFALSLYWAVRAYELPPGETRELGRRLWRRFRDHPGDFFLAPKADLAVPTGEGAEEAEEADEANRTDGR
jgi:hypothetical protein